MLISGEEGGEFAVLPQFFPIFNIGGMKLDQVCFHISILSETKKEVFTGNWRVFVPEITWKPKKGPNIIQRSDADHIPIIGGMQM